MLRSFVVRVVGFYTSGTGSKKTFRVICDFVSMNPRIWSCSNIRPMCLPQKHRQLH